MATVEFCIALFPFLRARVASVRRTDSPKLLLGRPQMDKNMIESTSPTSLLLRTVDMFSLSMQFYGCSLSRTLMKAYAYIYNVTHTHIYIYTH